MNKPRKPTGRPVLRKVTIKLVKKPVRMGSGGLVNNGLRSVVKNGKRVYYT